MNLYLLRHAEAVELGERKTRTDRERMLTLSGRKRARKVAKALKKLGLQFDQILSSPFPRAWQTAEIVARTLASGDKLGAVPALQPGGNLNSLIQQLQKSPPKSQILLVGHEPAMSDLVSQLASRSGEVEVRFRKAGLCKLSTDRLSAGQCAEIDWLLTPDLLELLARV